MNKYSQLSKLLTKVVTTKQSLKSIVFKSNDEKFVQQSYALLHKAMQNFNQLQEIIRQLMELDYFQINDHNLLIILILEIFNPNNRKAKKIGGQISKYLKKHHTLITNLLNFYHIYDKQSKIIYVRFFDNTVPLFGMIDEHIPNLVKVDYEIYSQFIKDNPEFLKSNNYVVQSKSSALPAFLLMRSIKKQNMNFDIIDCCSAPGNKTIQLFQYMKQKQLNGTLFAIEKDFQRFNLLNNRLQKYNCDVKTFNMDFLDVNPQDYFNVKLALLDPSCSGSGMIKQRVVEGLDDVDLSVPFEKIEQVKNLQYMQINLLNHLTKFPKLKRIIYSTCSIYKEENEFVANQFINQNPNWTVINLFPEWQTRGIDNKNYVRIFPGETDGFFIAMFKRKI